MSEYFTASTMVGIQQSASAFAEVIAAAFSVVAEEVVSLFDFSVPSYDTSKLLRTVNQYAQQLTSTHMATLKAQLPSLSESHIYLLAHTQAMLQSIKSQPLVKFGIERLKTNEWTNVQNLLNITQHQLQRGEVKEAIKSAQQAQQILKSGLREVKTRLSNAQHSYVASSAAQTLKEMGYQIQVARSSLTSWTSLWATKGGKAIGVVISPESQVTVDMLGWEGTSCQEELISFRQGMEKRGIQFREGKRFHHGRREGGALIQQAAKLVRSRGLSFPDALLYLVQGSHHSDQRRRQTANILLIQRQREG